MSCQSMNTIQATSTASDATLKGGGKMKLWDFQVRIFDARSIQWCPWHRHEFTIFRTNDQYYE